MATFFTGTDADGITLTANGDLWINNTFTTVSAPGDAFNFAATTGNRLLVLGTIVSEDSDAINSNTGSSSNRVEVMSGGVVTGISDGIELEGSFNQVMNRGNVTGLGDCGIQFFGNEGSSMVNYGSVYGQIAAFNVSGTSNTMDNLGDLAGASRAVLIEGGGNNVLTNSGTIQADVAIQITSVTGLVNTVTNSGTIAGRFAFQSFNGDESLTNSGTMTGQIETGAGVDIVRNTGTISGAIDLGDGADAYFGRGDGSAVSVFGGLGADIIAGGERDDDFFGGDDSDTLRGGAGDDTLDGGNAADIVRGGSGDDSILGGTGNDKVYGGSGDDVIDGGRNTDILVGGAGEDIFVISTQSGTDTILDFVNDVDTLDLSALGFATVADAMATAANVNGNTVFTFGANQLTVLGITVGQITNDVSVNSLGMATAMEAPATGSWWP